VELHLHGSRAVVAGVLDCLQNLHQTPTEMIKEDWAPFNISKPLTVKSPVITRSFDDGAQLPRLRIAERGEFTRRAFDNGRLGLTVKQDTHI
jgi:tRNA U34 5-carboxymethylaminomethyl modifying GTPase MnmE/TrmE